MTFGKIAFVEEQDLASDHDDSDDGGLTALTGVEAAARLARKEEEQAQARLEETRRTFLFKRRQASDEIESAMQEAEGWKVDMNYSVEVMEYLEKAIWKAKQTGMRVDATGPAEQRLNAIHSTLRRHLGVASLYVTE